MDAVSLAYCIDMYGTKPESDMSDEQSKQKSHIDAWQNTRHQKLSQVMLGSRQRITMSCEKRLA